jgi:hypothetical protein
MFHDLLKFFSHENTIFQIFVEYLTLCDLACLDTSVTNDLSRPILLNLFQKIYRGKSVFNNDKIPDNAIPWIALRGLQTPFVLIKPSQYQTINLNFFYHFPQTTIQIIKLISFDHFIDLSYSSLSSSFTFPSLSSILEINLSQSSKPLSDQNILHLFHFSFPNLRILNLCHQTQLTSKSLKLILKSINSLHQIILNSCHQLNNSSIKDFIFKNSETLSHLSLQDCSQISPRTFREISKVLSSNHLISLNLSHCLTLSDSSLQKILKKCQNLKYLNISNTLITVFAFTSLLKSIHLFQFIANSCSKINDRCLGIISCLYRQLKCISLMNSSVEHASLVSLSQCSQLEELSVSCPATSLPTNGLAYLICKCNLLKVITFIGPPLSSLPSPSPSPPLVATAHLNNDGTTTSSSRELREYRLPTLSHRLSQYGQNITQLSFTQIHFNFQDFQILATSSCCPLLSSLTLHSCFHFQENNEWDEFIHFLISSLRLKHLSLSPHRDSQWSLNMITKIVMAREYQWISLKLSTSSLSDFLPLSDDDILALMSCHHLETLHISQLNDEQSKILKTSLERLPRLSSIALVGSKSLQG